MMSWSLSRIEPSSRARSVRLARVESRMRVRMPSARSPFQSPSVAILWAAVSVALFACASGQVDHALAGPSADRDRRTARKDLDVVQHLDRECADFGKSSTRFPLTRISGSSASSPSSAWISPSNSSIVLTP